MKPDMARRGSLAAYGLTALRAPKRIHRATPQVPTRLTALRAPKATYDNP